MPQLLIHNTHPNTTTLAAVERERERERERESKSYTLFISSFNKFRRTAYD